MDASSPDLALTAASFAAAKQPNIVWYVRCVVLKLVLDATCAVVGEVATGTLATDAQPHMQTTAEIDASSASAQGPHSSSRSRPLAANTAFIALSSRTTQVPHRRPGSNVGRFIPREGRRGPDAADEVRGH